MHEPELDFQLEAFRSRSETFCTRDRHFPATEPAHQGVIRVPSNLFREQRPRLLLLFLVRRKGVPFGGVECHGRERFEDVQLQRVLYGHKCN